MRTLTIFVLAMLIAACGKQAPPTAPTAPTTQVAKLQWIQMRYGIYLARSETNISITPRGFLRQVRIEGKGTSSKPRTETRVGQLTPGQIAELVKLFEGWESYDAEYENVADGPHIEIQYGSKKITGGTGLPPRIQEIEQRLRELANAMPALAPHSKEPK